MLKISIIVFLLFGAIVHDKAYGQETLNNVQTKIHTYRQKDKTTFKPYFYNSTDRSFENLFYDFLIEKTGASGTSTTSQSGHFSVEAGDSVLLSKVELNLHEHDKCILHLRIFKNKKIIQDSKLEYPLNKKTNVKTEPNEKFSY